MGVRLVVIGDHAPRTERFADRARERGLTVDRGFQAMASDEETRNITIYTGQAPPKEPVSVWLRLAEGNDACACVAEGCRLQENCPADFVGTQYLPVANVVGVMHTVHSPWGVAHSFQSEDDMDAYLLDHLLPEREAM